MLDTSQTTFLARHLKVVPKSTTDAIDTLSKKYPGMTFAPCQADPSLIRIGGAAHASGAGSKEGGIDMDPRTIAFLGTKPNLPDKTGAVSPGDRLTTLIDGLSSSDAKVRARTMADFQKSDNERFRFDETYQKTVTELEKVPADLTDLQPILDNATPGGKNRLAQIQISHKNPEDAAINTRGVELALKMGATNCYEVVAYVEFFYKIIAEKKLEIDEAVEKREKPKSTPKKTKKKMKMDELLDYMGNATLKPERLAEAKLQIDAYKTAMAPYCAAAFTNTALDGASNDDAKALLESNSANLYFTDQVNGGYHLLKHFVEMYGDKLHAGDLDAQALHYTTKAREAIASSTSWEASLGQTGSMSHKFTKDHTAYVPVKGAGAVLASYF